MTKVQERLFSIADKNFAEYESRMIPELSPSLFIGVKLKTLREFSKVFKGTPECYQFLESLPHQYFEENLLHSILVREIDSYDECIKQVDFFLPYIDNWVVCDSLRPKTFETHAGQLIHKCKAWLKSSQSYTVRFGLDVLRTCFLDKNYKPEYLSLAASINSDDQVVLSAQSLLFSSALVKQWKDAILILERCKLKASVHNDAIHKACENYLIEPEKKEVLQSFLIKIIAK